MKIRPLLAARECVFLQECEGLLVGLKRGGCSAQANGSGFSRELCGDGVVRG